MLTPVERVLILKGVDLLKDVGPRHLVGLANVAREVEVSEGDVIYNEEDRSDVLYIVVEGKVELSANGRVTSEVGPGEAFGTWSLVDDSARGHRALCVAEGRTLSLQRDDFYDLAAGDLTLLTELVRVLAKRLRALASAAPPEESRVEGEGIERPAALVEEEAAAAAADPVTPPSAGAALQAAVLGKPVASPDDTASAPPSTEAAGTPPPVQVSEPLGPAPPDAARS
ncbi:MAG TPA: cyclic nucleotide-binding domain-containing protein [Candidatus Eisenbacteria bacterium]|nr:cyclic nucleotide-binding domain-containing protein [Candidatus Eisenbacteria bacterium]